MEKQCSKCKSTLPREEFYTVKNNRPCCWCKDCMRANAAAAYRDPLRRVQALARRAAYHAKNRDRILRQNREGIVRRKLEVFRHYGNGIVACVCCGVTEIEFLTLDHVAANGGEHRRELKKKGVGGHASGWFIYKWLIDNDYPDGYQTLCFNCNVGKHRTKLNICPHELERQRLLGLQSAVKAA